MIKLRDISQKYKTNYALKNISLEIVSGKFYALLGHNGAGKSTLLNIIAGLEYPTGGKGNILGYELGQDLGFEKSQLGYISESVNFNLPASLEDFFIHYSKIYKNWDHDLFKKLMRQQDIDLAKNFSEFSRGQKMQIVLIAAISRHPKILLIDEITSVLDVNARSFFINYLKDFSIGGGVVVMTTNIIHEVNQHATDLVILQHGSVIYRDNCTNMEKMFIKLRKDEKNSAHEIFNRDECIWIGKNTDHSDSYIITKEFSESLNLSSLLDRRKIIMSEVFMYFNELDKSLTRKVA